VPRYILNKMKNRIHKRPTIGIFGQARHGKDAAAEYWAEHFGLTYQSSSMAAAQIFIFDALKDKYGYKTLEECFEDRVNHRTEWFDLITAYNAEDETKLGTEIVKLTGCYVGMRRMEEAVACKKKGVFDILIWIDASERVPAEDVSSCTITKEVTDFTIHNNGTLEEFHERLQRIGKIIL
jgi:hypothetical protein